MSVLRDNPFRLRSFSRIFGKRLRGTIPHRLYFFSYVFGFKWRLSVLVTYFFLLKGEDFGCLGWIPDKKQKGGFFVTFFCFGDIICLKTLLSFDGTFWEFSWGRWYWMLLEEDSWQGGEGDGVTGGIRGGCPFTFYIPHQRHYTRKYPRLCQRPIQRINAPHRHWTNIFMDLRYLVNVDSNCEGQRATTRHFLLLSWYYQHLDNWRMLCEKMILRLFTWEESPRTNFCSQ